MSTRKPAEPASSLITTKPPIGCAMLMMDLFRSYLHEQRLPVTQQREAIAMTLFETEQHLSVDDLAETLRQRGEHVGKATIYRTLNLLVQAGSGAGARFWRGVQALRAPGGRGAARPPDLYGMRPGDSLYPGCIRPIAG